MTEPQFDTVTVPPTDDTTDAGPTTASDDLTCRVCGAPLSYSGRGRKPTLCDEHKRAATTTPRSSSRGATTADVNAALAQMDMLYGVLATGLMMLSPEAAMTFNARVETAQAVNRQAFEADRSLAKRIGGVSQSAAPLMFYGANAFLIGPPLRIAYGEIIARRTSKKAPVDDGASPFVDFVPDPSQSQNGHGLS